MTKLINGNNNFWKEEFEKLPIIFQNLLFRKQVTIDPLQLHTLIINDEKLIKLQITDQNGYGYKYTTLGDQIDACLGITKLYNFIENGLCFGYSKASDVFYTFENIENQIYGPILIFSQQFVFVGNNGYFINDVKTSEIEFKNYLKKQKHLLVNQNILIKELNAIVVDYLNPFN